MPNEPHKPSPTHGVTLRSATPADAQDIAPLMGQLGYPAEPAEVVERLTRLLSSDTDGVIVADEAGKVVGVASMHLTSVLHASDFLGRITSLVVAEDRRGRGIGQALLHEAESWLWAHGCRRIEITSADHRAQAHLFYESCGYAKVQSRFIKRRSDEG
ncbi:MAG: GNAT family N-acetyltransferase [Phycisphaeraceae bacterium]|nr:GNAT family N-acetyltransferase [Phycisphaeraceae bacterium]